MSNNIVCRLCLGHFSIGYSLLDEINASMLETLTAIKISATDDEFSKSACAKCILNLRLAFNIQQTILKSHEQLLNSIPKVFDIKTDSLDSIITNVITVQEISNNNIDQLLLDDEFIQNEDNETSADPKPEIDECIVLIKESEPPPPDGDQQQKTVLCIICRKQMKQDDLTAHVQQHFLNQLECNFCTKICRNINDYKEHVKSENHTIPNESYRCVHCGITFKYGPLYLIHFKAHKPSNAPSDGRFRKCETFDQTWDIPLHGPYKCHICNKTFDSRRRFMQHSHAKRKCPICDVEVSKTNLTKHISNHTSGPQICDLCGATLRSVESLRGHIAHTHSKLSLKCGECGQIFKKRYAYNIHMKKHAGDKEYVCENCGKAFLTLYSMTKHINMAHLKLRPYICEYCNRGYSSKFALRTHVRQHTNETPYKCDVCGEGYRQNVSLKAHRKSKHNIVEKKTCACKICGKEFSNLHAIDSHMRLH